MSITGLKRVHEDISCNYKFTSERSNVFAQLQSPRLPIEPPNSAVPGGVPQGGTVPTTTQQPNKKTNCTVVYTRAINGKSYSDLCRNEENEPRRGDLVFVAAEEARSVSGGTNRMSTLCGVDALNRRLKTSTPKESARLLRLFRPDGFLHTFEKNIKQPSGATEAVTTDVLVDISGPSEAHNIFTGSRPQIMGMIAVAVVMLPPGTPIPTQIATGEQEASRPSGLLAAQNVTQMMPGEANEGLLGSHGTPLPTGAPLTGPTGLSGAAYGRFYLKPFAYSQLEDASFIYAARRRSTLSSAIVTPTTAPNVYSPLTDYEITRIVGAWSLGRILDTNVSPGQIQVNFNAQWVPCNGVFGLRRLFSKLYSIGSGLPNWTSLWSPLLLPFKIPYSAPRIGAAIARWKAKKAAVGTTALTEADILKIQGDLAALVASLEAGVLADASDWEGPVEPELVILGVRVLTGPPLPVPSPDDTLVPTLEGVDAVLKMVSPIIMEMRSGDRGLDAETIAILSAARDATLDLANEDVFDEMKAALMTRSVEEVAEILKEKTKESKLARVVSYVEVINSLLA